MKESWYLAERRLKVLRLGFFPLQRDLFDIVQHSFRNEDYIFHVAVLFFKVGMCKL